jgi:hypothetical protein
MTGAGTVEAPRPVPAPVAAPRGTVEDERAARMAALAERIQGMAPAAKGGGAPVAAILGALNANRAANQSGKSNLNPVRRTLDEDLFAA